MVSKKKKNYKDGLIYKTEKDPHIQKTNLWLPKGKGEGRDKFGSLGLTDTDCQILNR